MILDLLRQRFAAKQFNGQPISPEALQTILEAMRLTPSSCNVQPWHVMVVDDRKTLNRLYPACHDQPKLLTCASVLVVCARQDLLGADGWLEKVITQAKTDRGSTDGNSDAYRQMVKKYVQDMAPDDLLAWTQKQCYLAVMTALLAAADQNVDACPMEYFVPDRVSALLDLPDHLVPTIVIALGHADQTRPPKTRLPLDAIISTYHV